MDYLDANQAADYLDVSKSTLYAYVSRGRLESIETEGDQRRRQYRKADLDRLRRRSDAASGDGPSAGDALHWGQPSLETDVGSISARGPCYRGVPLSSILCDNWSFSEVASLIWSGERKTWKIDAAATDTMDIAPAQTPPITTLREITLEAGRSSEGDTQCRSAWIELITKTIRRLSPRPRPNQPCEPSACLAQFIHHYERRPQHEQSPNGSSRRPPGPLLEIIDNILMIVADHGLNASTFTGRISASAGAGLFDALTASLATFSGDRHGRHFTRVRHMIHDLAHTDLDPQSWVTRRLTGANSIPGFGHPLYEHGDPRYRWVRRAVTELTEDHQILSQYDQLQSAATDAGVAPPNLDVGLALAADAFDISDDSMAFLFAVGRMVGWLAHIREQSRRNHVLRPTAT